MAESGRTRLRDHIAPPGEHGGDAMRIARSLGLDPTQMIDLSASMNPFAPDVSAIARRLLDSDLGALTRYPDSHEAERLLADAIGVPSDRTVLTNGGAEAIALVANLLERGHVADPEFALYRRHLSIVEPTAGRWRSNPSNPLGRLAQPGEQAAVWDEAFYPIATGTWSRGDDAWRLGSLTKLWTCPGLRLGYAVAPDPNSATQLRRRRPQWSVNGLALGCLPELLDRTDIAEWNTQLSRLRTDFADRITTLGFTAHATDSNWILVERPDLRNELAPSRIIVRDCASFGMTDIHRVAVPRPDQLEEVLAAFAGLANHAT